MDDVYFPSLDSVEAGAPANEIEITPEMIRAGPLIFLDYDSRFEEPADCVVDIFRKMLYVMGHREAVSDPPGSGSI